MSKLEKVGYAFAVSVLLSFVCILSINFLISHPKVVEGNIPSSDAMQSTTTGAVTGVGDGTLLCTGSAILGSINITGPKVGSQFQIVDATTTIAANRAISATSSLILADIPFTVLGNATTTGNFAFNSFARRGLIIASVGGSTNLATTTISYRCLSN